MTTSTARPAPPSSSGTRIVTSSPTAKPAPSGLPIRSWATGVEHATWISAVGLVKVDTPVQVRPIVVTVVPTVVGSTGTSRPS